MFKRYIVFLFAFIAVSGSISAQVRPGIKMGYNLSGVMAEDKASRSQNQSGNPDNFKLNHGFQFGLIADYPINDALALQPGAKFALMGFTDEYRPNLPELRRFHLYYLQVPVNVQYRLNVAEETNLLFQAGPYVGFGLFGRQTFIQNANTQELNDDRKKIDYGNDTPRLDYGVGAGFGIEFHRFQFMLAYDFGLNKKNFEKGRGKSWGFLYDMDMQHQSFSVTLGIIFGRRDPLQHVRDF